MPSRPYRAALVLPVAVIACACGQILGLDAFHDGICTPGTNVECPYTGPAGTKDVGVCHAGSKTCRGDGQDYDPCEGEVTPKPEDCSTPVDDNCDGQVNEATAGCICTPKVEQPCYTGPAGTLGVGVCTGGMHACNNDGVSYGPCEGEVTPTPEDCSTPLDENCNGQVNEPSAGCECSPGQPVACYDGPAATMGVGTCAGGTATCDPDGIHHGTCTGEVTPAAADDCALGIDADCDGKRCGEAIWSYDYGGIDDQYATSLATDAAGNIYVAGTFRGVLTIGSHSLNSAGGEDVFLAKLDPSGSFVWGTSFGDATNNQVANGVAVDSAGNVIVVGWFLGSMTVGTTTLAAGTTSTNAFVAKFDGAGNALWSHSYGDAANYQSAASVAVNSQGDIFVTGYFEGSINFGTGSMSAAGPYDLFVAKLSGGTGAALWSRQTGSAGQTTSGASIAVDSSGSVVVAGIYLGAFVERLDTLGNTTWSTSYGDNASAARGVAVDGNGHILVTGNSHVIAPPGPMFVMQLDVFGNMTWTKGSTASFGAGVATDSAGNVFVSGALNGSADFGGGMLTGPAFLAKFGPDGSHAWSRVYGMGTGTNFSAAEWCPAVAAPSADEVVVACSINGTMDFGGTPLMTSGGIDIALAKIAAR